MRIMLSSENFGHKRYFIVTMSIANPKDIELCPRISHQFCH